MTQILAAFIPVIALLTLGHLLSRTLIKNKDVWSGAESLIFYVFFPALIVSIFNNMPTDKIPWTLFFVLFSAQLVMAAIGESVCRVLSWPARIKGVIVQSNLRTNAFIALGLTSSLLGPEALATSAIVLTLLIPSSNILAVGALSVGLGEKQEHFQRVFKGIVKNPLVIAAVLGVALAYSNVNLPDPIDQTLSMLGQPVVALGLLTVGAAVRMDFLKQNVSPVIFWSLFRLTAFPLISGSLAIWAGLSEGLTLVAILAVAAPTASGGYILAKKLGADADTAASLIALQTILGVVTAPLVYWAWSSLS